MGRGIAQVALAAGHQVILVDPDRAQLTSAAEDIMARLERKSPGLGTETAGRLTMVEKMADARRLPGTVVVEAVVEQIAVKVDVLTSARKHFGPDCILATNTSSLSVTEIGAGTSAPERVVGMHFFNPVPAMRLVEVVRGLVSDPVVVDEVAALARSWGKHVAVVRSSPGFVVNRVARAFYGEALRLAEEGAATPECIDEVMRSAGQFRMGPFELMDLIGVEVNHAVSRTVWEAYHFEPRFTPSLLQAELVAAGRFGRKTGHGFYAYGEGAVKPTPVPIDHPQEPPAGVAVLGSDDQLVSIAARAGITRSPRDDGSIEFGDLGCAVLTRGVTAREESRRLGRPVVVVDRVVTPSDATGLAVTGTDDRLLGAVAAVIHRAGIRPYLVKDTPGLIVARILSMISNEAYETVHQGVATEDSIDTAMVLGTNYPCGPFAWARRWGVDCVRDILDNVWADYHDPRYRVSSALRAAAG
jgi:3-hydroxybutyryl-CoA dehydrogenase